MNISLKSLTYLFFLSNFLYYSGWANTNSRSSSPPENNQIQAYEGLENETTLFLVAIPPFLYLADRITEGLPQLQAQSLLTESDNPHLYLPTSKDIKLMQKAKFFFTSEMDFERELLRKVKSHLLHMNVHSLRPASVKKNGHEEGHDDEHEDGHDDEHEDGHDDEHEDGHDDEHEDGHDDEHEQGHDDEHEDGHDDEHEDGHDDEHEDGHDDEHEDGHDDEHEDGHDDEHEDGHDDEHEDGHDDEHEDGHDDEHEDGHDDEHEDGHDDEHEDGHDEHNANSFNSIEKKNFFQRIKIFFRAKVKRHSHNHKEMQHFWTDPKNYSTSAKRITQTLVASFPSLQNQLENNYKILQQEIDDTDAQISLMQNEWQRKNGKSTLPVFSLHRFLEAFSLRYGIEEKSLEDENGEVHGKRNLRWQSWIREALHNEQKVIMVFTPETLYANNPLSGSIIFSLPEDSRIEMHRTANLNSSNFTATMNSRKIKINVTRKFFNPKKKIDAKQIALVQDNIYGVLINPLQYEWLKEIQILAHAFWQTTTPHLASEKEQQ